MNVQEWYSQMRDSKVPLQFAAEQLAERDAKLESSQRQAADKTMKIVNQRGDIEYLRGLIGDERKAHLETKQKLEAAEKRGAVAMSRLIENWLSKEYMPKILGFDFAKGEPWIARTYATGWGSSGKTAQATPEQQEAAFRPLTRIERRAEARRCRDAGIKPLPGTYGEDDLRELEIFEQVKRDTPDCNQGEECSACNTIAAWRFEELRLARAPTQTTSDQGAGSCGESAAEDEARETESLAHRIERHDTQFRRTTERFDRHAKKLTELDGEIRHARDSRRKMHAQIGALESNIADIRKTAEADRVEFRAADAAVYERIANLDRAVYERISAVTGAVLERVQKVEKKLFGP
jgi:hypothetical protein